MVTDLLEPIGENWHTLPLFSALAFHNGKNATWMIPLALPMTPSTSDKMWWTSVEQPLSFAGAFAPGWLHVCLCHAFLCSKAACLCVFLLFYGRTTNRNGDDDDDDALARISHAATAVPLLKLSFAVLLWTTHGRSRQPCLFVTQTSRL